MSTRAAAPGPPTPRPRLRLAWQWDLARQVERLDWLLAQLPRYADWGYTELYLHLEDAVEYPSLPAIARRGAYSYRQLERLVARAAQLGIGVVPIVNLLGHTQYLIKVPELRDLNELRQPDGSPQLAGQVCPLHPRTLEIAEALLRDMRPFCTTPDHKVHVGLDESFHLGRHPLSRREVQRIGLGAHFASYVAKLRTLTRTLGLRMGIWADMLALLPQAIPLLPRDLIAYDWYYYPFKKRPHIELLNYREVDLTAPLIAHGIEYWACPMNGAFRHEPLPHFGDRLGNLAAWERRAKEVGASGLLMTGWEPNRLALATTTLIDAAATLPPAPPQRRLAAATQRALCVQSGKAARIAKLLLAADAFPFSGYARWEINKSWALATDIDAATLGAELRFFRSAEREIGRLVSEAEAPPARATRSPARTPSRGRPHAPRVSGLEALAASLGYRTYLAARDHFVRCARAGGLNLRRDYCAAQLRRLQRQAADFANAIDAGETAARRMWAATRKPSQHAPNLRLLAADRRQLCAWEKWLARVAQAPARVSTRSPLFGCWQLRYTVENFAPALQRIAVDEWRLGQWQELKNCYTLEFTSAATGTLPLGTKRRALLRRTHIVPCLATSSAPPRLRFRVGGCGEIKIGQVELSAGEQALRPEAWRGFRKLGRAAALGDALPDLAAEQQCELHFD